MKARLIKILLLDLLLCFSVLKYPDSNAQLLFSDVTSQMGIFGEDYATNAVVFFDCDNDGLLDIFIGNYRGGNIQYLNHAGYVFFDVSETSAIGPGSYGYMTRRAAAADYDNDGDMDLFLGNSLDQPNFLYQNLGNLKFQEVSHDAGILGEAWSNAAVWADYNNNGLIDLFVGNEKSSSCLYTNLGNGIFRNDIVNARLGNNLRSSNALFADFDNDGFQKTNYYQITWDGTDDYGNKVGSGVYLCQMNSGNFMGMKKMILLQ